MGCPCKNKITTISEQVGMDLILKYAINNEVLPTGDRNILYQYYDQTHNTKTPTRCISCWDEYIKQNLVTLWMTRNVSTNEPQR